MTTPIVTLLDRAIDRYLALDPEGRKAFGELEGKVVAIELRGMNTCLFLAPCADGIRITEHFDGEPDARLIATPIALLKLGLSDSLRRGFLSDDVEIRGDIDTGKRFREILDRIDIDWEEPLARLGGDVFAHQAGNAARKLGRWASTSLGTLTDDVAEYLKEEARVAPSRIELENFYADVDQLRMAVDRLDARLRRLRARQQPAPADAPGDGSL